MNIADIDNTLVIKYKSDDIWVSSVLIVITVLLTSIVIHVEVTICHDFGRKDILL